MHRSHHCIVHGLAKRLAIRTVDLQGLGHDEQALGDELVGVTSDAAGRLLRDIHRPDSRAGDRRRNLRARPGKDGAAHSCLHQIRPRADQDRRHHTSRRAKDTRLCLVPQLRW